MVIDPYDTFLDLFVVPGNSVGIPVPARVKCPLTAKGDKLLASYIRDLTEAGAPGAEIDAATALARHGHLRRKQLGGDTGIDCGGFHPESHFTHILIALSKAKIGFFRAQNYLKCFLDVESELVEIHDRYGEYPSEGRKWSTPELPEMTVEVHNPSSDEDASDILYYEAAPEHPPSPPLPQLTDIAQIADLTRDELDQYLKFYVIDVSEADDHTARLELLKKEIGIDCVGAAESLTEDESKAVSSYFRLVGSQLTDSEAALLRYPKVNLDGEESPRDSELDVKRPCKMFRQQMLAARVLEAKYRNLLKHRPWLGGDLEEVPDCYGNVPSGGRDVYIPAQVASRTPVHIPGVDKHIRYVVLRAIPEHLIVQPLPALTQMTRVLDLTPDLVNQYLKFYCAVVPEHANIDQRLELLKVELSIAHIGPAYIRRYPEDMERLMGSAPKPRKKSRRRKQPR